MAEISGYSQILAELKAQNPEIYSEMTMFYQQSDWDRLANNEIALQEFVERCQQRIAENAKAKEVLDSAVGAQIDEANEGEVSNEELGTDGGSSENGGSEEEKAARVEPMLSDPYHWEEFYAPAPEEEAKRFDDAYQLLNSEEGKEFQKTPRWTATNLSFGNNKDQALNETLDMCACRRLASSNEKVTLESLSDARMEESMRIKVEYYNSLFAIEHKNDYNSIKAETHLNRVLKIDQAVREGKSEQEIFKMLGINPKEDTQKTALNTAIHANIQPLSNFVDKKKSFRKAMHSFGQVMDKLQKLEQNHPLLALGVNSFLAGNVAYMGFRSVLASRALYNDYQGFKDYATFREVYKDQISEQGFKRWQEQNKESKVGKNDYDQVKKYDSYSAYLEKHSVNHISEEEFKQLKKFQKKQEFTREEFDTLRQVGGNYEAYAAQFKEKAVSKELYDSIGKYADIRRAQDYGEYTKKAGDRAVSEQEYNQVKVLTRSVGKISMSQALKDKTTRKAMMAHSVIFARSLPVIGQTYALGMAAKKMTQKSYWQGMKARVQESGKAIKTLWVKRGRDKEAWKQLRDNGATLLAEVGGTGLLFLGTQNLFAQGSNFVDEVRTSDQSFGEVVGSEIQKSVNDSITKMQNMPNEIVNAPADIANRVTNAVDSVQNFILGEHQAVADNTKSSEQPVQTDSISLDARAEAMREALARDHTATMDSVTHDSIMQQPRDNVRIDTPVRPNDDIRFDADPEALREVLAKDHTTTADTIQNDTLKFDFNKEFAQYQWPNQGAAFAAADSATVEDVKVPYALGEHPLEQDAVQLDQGVVDDGKTVTLNDEQKANLESLFKMYPRAATIILEGNENPSINDVTKGGFSVEGENKLYSSGVISSAKLQELYESGKFSSEQMQSLTKFADAHFENGQMNDALRNELYGHSPEVKHEQQSSEDRSKSDVAAKEDNTGTEHNVASEEKVDAYSFDKNGNIIYHPDALKDMAGMNPEDYDARVYQDLLRRQAAGETLDAGALKFLDNYKTVHPDVQDLSVQNNNEAPREVVEEEYVTEQSHQEQGAEEKLSGITLHHRDMENGGYELYGSGEMNGKMIDVSNYYDESGKLQVTQYTVHEGEDKSTIIKSQMLDGRAYTVVTEIDGDKTTTREIDGNASKVMREILGENDQKSSEGKETKGLEESKKLVSDEERNEREEPAQSDKVRSSTFRGKYWMEEDANGMPQLHCRMSNPQAIQADRELVHAFQNTIGGSGHDYHALGGLLRADNYGAEHRDNPSMSGIMVKCEYLAQTIARNEAVYQDMEHRIEQGETLDKIEMQWRQNYESDMEKIGLTRENGRLIYSPAHHQADILERSTEQNEALSANEDNSERRVYNLDENGQETKVEDKSGEQMTEQQSVEPTRLNRGGFNGTYTITDTENGYKFASNGSVQVDQTILNAVRPNMHYPDENGNYVGANGMIKSENFNVANSKATMLAQSLTRNEAIYSHLMEEGEWRDLTNGERLFMSQHDKTLSSAGLERDTNGEIIRKNEYEGQARAAARRGRGYGD